MSIDNQARGLALNGIGGVGLLNRRFIGKKMLVASQCGALGGNGTSSKSDGTQTSMMCRYRHYFPAKATHIQFVYANWRIKELDATAAGEVDGDNDITVRAGCEIANASASIGMHFFGQRSVTIEPGGEVTTDPISLDFAAGAFAISRSYVSVNSLGERWPIGRYANTGIGNAIINGGSDETLGVGPLSGGVAGYGYGPIAVIGLQYTAAPTVVILADSIDGSGDTSPAGDSYGDVGFLQRALANNLAWATVSRAGQAALAQMTTHYRQWRAVTGHATDALWQLGVNDMKASTTAAEMQANLLTAAGYFGGRGMRFHVTTLTPVTTGTFTTEAGQTVNATVAAKRAVYNGWLRDGAPIVAGAAVAAGTVDALRVGQPGHPIYHVHDPAALIEGLTDPDKWQPNMAVDGTHPTTLGHTTMVGGIDMSAFTIA